VPSTATAEAEKAEAERAAAEQAAAEQAAAERAAAEKAAAERLREEQKLKAAQAAEQARLAALKVSIHQSARFQPRTA